MLTCDIKPLKGSGNEDLTVDELGAVNFQRWRQLKALGFSHADVFQVSSLLACEPEDKSSMSRLVYELCYAFKVRSDWMPWPSMQQLHAVYSSMSQSDRHDLSCMRLSHVLVGGFSSAHCIASCTMLCTVGWTILSVAALLKRDCVPCKPVDCRRLQAVASQISTSCS